MGTATMSKPTAVSLLLWDRPADMRMYRSTAAAAACECGQCHVVSVRRPQNTDLFDVHKACLSTFCSISLFYRLVQLAFSAAVFKLGSADQRGSTTVPTGSSRGFRKVVIVCTVFNNLRPICFQICTRTSVTQSQCIAWKCCRGLARQASVDVS